MPDKDLDKLLAAIAVASALETGDEDDDLDRLVATLALFEGESDD